MATALSSIVTALGLGFVAAEAALAKRQLAHDRETQRDQLLNDRSQQWDSEFLASARQLADSCGNSINLAERMGELYTDKSADFYILLRLPNYFEDLAYLVKRGRLPLEHVYELLGSTIVARYETFAPAIEVLRQRSGTPTAYDHWAWLRDELVKFEASRGRPQRRWSRRR